MAKSVSVSAAGDTNNKFSWDVHRKLASGGEGNLVYSPLSIHTALVIAYHGARGNTAQQLAKALHLAEAGSEQQEKLLGDHQLLLKSLHSRHKDYTLHQANRLYVQSKSDINTDFKNLLKSCYNAELGAVNFSESLKTAKEINTWVEKQTNSRIKNLLSPDSIDSLTKAVVVNAIYFKGLWLEKFNPKRTVTKPFYKSKHVKIDVKMMCQYGEKYKLSVDASLKARALELPYAKKELSMVIVLPDEISGLQEVETRLTSSKLHVLVANMRKRELDCVMIPRFKLEFLFSLAHQLRSLGIRDLFGEQCDLSGMCPGDLSVSDVIHKAFIEVNEEGTEAAAATAIVMKDKCTVPRSPLTFVADHSFLFFIRESKSGAILFMGRVVQPTAS